MFWTKIRLLGQTGFFHFIMFPRKVFRACSCPPMSVVATVTETAKRALWVYIFHNVFFLCLFRHTRLRNTMDGCTTINYINYNDLETFDVTIFDSIFLSLVFTFTAQSEYFFIFLLNWLKFSWNEILLVKFLDKSMSSYVSAIIFFQ